MIRRIAKTAFYILSPLGVLVLLGFAVGNNQSSQCRSFIVKIHEATEIRFVDSADVAKQVHQKIGQLNGLPMNAVPLKRIEELINTIYFVETSRVYRTIDGHVIADITQREPVARVINSMNESYYIDKNGRLMRTSHRYTARVPVVSGLVNTRYSPNFDIRELLEYSEEELLPSQITMIQLFSLLDYIKNDDFLSAWVDQIYVTRSGEFELVPRNGLHTIEIGDAGDLEMKFSKLIKFYKNGLTQVGWGHYKRINLKYKNQVVCSK